MNIDFEKMEKEFKHDLSHYERAFCKIVVGLGICFIPVVLNGFCVVFKAPLTSKQSTQLAILSLIMVCIIIFLLYKLIKYHRIISHYKDNQFKIKTYDEDVNTRTKKVHKRIASKKEIDKVYTKNDFVDAAINLVQDKYPKIKIVSHGIIPNDIIIDNDKLALLYYYTLDVMCVNAIDDQAKKIDIYTKFLGLTMVLELKQDYISTDKYEKVIKKKRKNYYDEQTQEKIDYAFELMPTLSKYTPQANMYKDKEKLVFDLVITDALRTPFNASFED